MGKIPEVGEGQKQNLEDEKVVSAVPDEKKKTTEEKNEEVETSTIETFDESHPVRKKKEKLKAVRENQII